MQSDSPIAVIGLAYRAPGVGRKGLWEYLAEAKCAWSRVPADRFEQDAYHNPEVGKKAGLFASKGAHFLTEDVYAFDAPFFNLRPDEVRGIDPQQRMILECALEAAENAGLTVADLAGANIGVYAANGAPDYGQQMGEDLPTTTTWSGVGCAPCMFANRLSYFFDLTGPSITLDAACASSTSAVHLACQSIRSGECSAAFIGAANLILGPAGASVLDTIGALSPEGKCFSYDSKASGFGRGEGGVCILIKSLEEAIKCGDPIQAVIRNSACNHTGRSEGITMPSRALQEKLLWRVHEEVGLSPADTPVVEGHGTGTQAGDPIEAGAFAAVLGRDRTPDNPLYIGSLKSNFGHLECASGLLAVVKAILMLQHDCVLPTAHFEKMNKNIEGGEKLKVLQTLMKWPRNTHKRVVVTNFGFGGSNSALLLEAAPVTGKLTDGTKNGIADTNGTNGDIKHHPHSSKQLFVVTAKTEKSLNSYLSSFVEYLDTAPESSDFVTDLSYTLGQRRTHHPWRVAAAADSIAGLKAQISVAKASKVKERVLAFAFTGQGAQHARMAVGLQCYKPFAVALAQAETHLFDVGASWSLIEELEKPESESRINDAEISQPACTAVQLALLALLESWGVKPATVTGHSSGEIAAAFAAGLVSFRAAVAIAYFRGQAATKLAQKGGQKGAMLALGVGFEEASALLEENKDGYATIAAINSPQSVTVSGDVSAIENIHRFADAKGLFVRRLKIDLAYHSRHMEQVADFYLASIKPFCSREPHDVSSSGETSNPVFVSSVTGGIEGADTVNASYWVKNLLQPVRFRDAIERVFSTPDSEATTEGQTSAKVPNVVVEIGPHATLKNPIKQTLEELRQRSDQPKTANAYLPSLVRGTGDDGALLGLAAALFTMGSPVQLTRVNLVDQHNARVLTNLPAYAWDKAARYIHTARMMDAKKHPKNAFHRLLGWKTPFGDGSEHRFRQVFSLDELPWIRDHGVNGNAIFPMTGYLSLAMEALRRISSTVPSSILIKEFYAKRSLEIAEEERVEISTVLRPAATGSEAFSSNTWAFEIMSWTEEHGWTAHCHGRIEAEASDLNMETPTMKASVPLIGSETLKERDVEREYATHEAGGTYYGPAFKGMRKMWDGPGSTVIETVLRDMNLSPPSPYGSLITIDPPTLDTLLHGTGPFQELSGTRKAHMPNYVSRIRISNNIPAAEKQRFTTVTRLLSHDAKAGSLHISVASFALGNGGELIPIAEMESISMRCVASSDQDDSVSSLPLSYRWELMPSLDFAEAGDLDKVITIDPQDDGELERRRKLDRTALYFMDKALKETAGEDLSQMPDHLAKFSTWTTRLLAQEKPDFSGDVKSLLTEVFNSNASGEMLCRVGEQLAPIMRGEVQPLEIMLKDGLLTRHYEQDMSSVRGNRVLAKYARYLSDVKADLRILEIGGGTGSATLPVLEELSRGTDSLPEFLTYTFTDISAGFFEGTRTKLARWEKRMTFKKLDISQDPAQQGFRLEDYDLIIASNVLHATANMAVTIDYVRSLLRPHGKLLLLEVTSHPARALPFALLPGWWLSEDDYRGPDGPVLTEKLWQRLLTSQGFSGVDSSVVDYPGCPEELVTVMCSTRVAKQGESDVKGQSITISGPLVDQEEKEFAQLVADQVKERLGCSAEVKPFLELNATNDQFCIILDSPRHCLLSDLSSDAFNTMKNTLLEATGVLWVVPEDHPPEAESIKGFFRTLRLETESKNILLLENTQCAAEGAHTISRIAQRLQDPEMAGHVDRDFVWHNGMIHVSRLQLMPTAREAYAFEAGVPLKKVQNIWEGQGSLELTVDSAGSPDSIYFRRTDAQAEPLGNDDILVKVEAAGMNFRDLLLVLGSIPWTTPGFEGAGTVVRTGSRVTDLQAGDRVFYGSLGGGGFATYMKMPSWRACKIPDGMSTADAASISVAYSTAIVAIMHVARLRKGESVLIHAASGAVGQACIVLAKHLGARIFATAGSTTKREFLHETFGIPKDHIFSSRTSEFREGVLNVTAGAGVDVVVNSLSGDLLQETWELMAEFGRFVEIGKRDLLQNSNLGMRPFDRNVSFSAIDLRKLSDQRPDALKECLADLTDLLQRNVIVPIHPVTQLPISQLAAGLRKLQSGQNIGKIVVTLGADDCVLAECSPPPGFVGDRLLSPDATYLITGGTGGIGISLAAWMVDNGARNVVLLGRSGSSRPEVKALLEKYEDTDARVKAIACDVGSRDDLVQALQSIKDLPPIRGVIHGALYLRDAMLVNATHDDWQKIRAPRVQGSWNLDELLPNLDFFVALSSFIGTIGNVGQSIYSGTATFFDAFARHRNARGLPTVSISLPLVLDVGYAVDRGLTTNLKTALGATLTEAYLRTEVKGAIVGPSSWLNADGHGVSFTIPTGNELSAQPWQLFHPSILARHIRSELQCSSQTNSQGQGRDTSGTGGQFATASDPLLWLLEGLADKVSAMTMIDRDEVEPDTALSNYGLDSLVSVELRNWIRRVTGVELPLPRIVGAANLRALATHILSQREARK